ncbi:methyltransferase domain-containing protein [Rhodoferax sp.]|uniref:class I SAM-dependent methyltransferase n=1 Tax=Rhodoferax sp. TaxID=50421 RepID=UPI00261BF697|nr:methyltransferase domain-containing protein [Rhodoferax sp.]MDD2920298.1 methyltransferase domain-containing protein [Rhodoferax sp.]
MTKNYQFDPVQRIWAKPGTSTLTYSDGDENEEYLFSVITNAKDVSANSPELASAIKDWPSEYHLSPVRHNLLRPFTLGPSDHILELGCGCGAMTRYLGETGAKVVAVEGSRRRAAIAAARCRDLPNVSVYCDNLIEFQADEAFNFVTLIGVLEYSNQFIAGPDPVCACLEKAGGFLAKDGALVVAIENQLGLKYFNGCNEDHVGIPYFGINGLYRNCDPVTFGRHALAAKFRESGFSVLDFFYPFPDYKLPGAILSEASLHDHRLNIADLLIHYTGRDYPETHQRAFSEGLAWRAVLENGLLPDLANSFVIFARVTDGTLRATNWLAKIYNRNNRRLCYQVETSIVPGNQGELNVVKRRLFPDAPLPHTAWLQHSVNASQYFTGNLLIGRIQATIAREASVDEIAGCFAPWLNFLRGNAEKTTDRLPGHFVDCIPSNLVCCTDTSLRYIDAEWVCHDSITLAWIIVRGIYHSLDGCLENYNTIHFTYRQLIEKIASLNGFKLTDADLVLANHYEKQLADQVLGSGSGPISLEEALESKVVGFYRAARNIAELRRSHAENEQEVARIKSTISWQVTKPFRFFSFLWRALKKQFQ